LGCFCKNRMKNELRNEHLHAYPFCKQACHYCDFHFRLR
jgi:coproporphyrinogen III oxidase-like Fe-S oxidoreductase